MEKVIYGDVLFAVNFSVDFIALYISASLTRCTVKTRTLIFSAAAGAVYGVAAVFFKGGRIAGTVIGVAMAAVMGYIAFGGKGLRQYIRGTLLFWGVSMAIGGALTAVFNLINRSRGVIYINGETAEIKSGAPAGAVIAAAAIAGAVTYIQGRIASAKASGPKSAELTLSIDEKTITVEAMCDSGSTACEPLSGRPAVTLTKKELEKLLPEGMKAAFEGRYDNAEDKYLKKLRFIPVRTVKGSGVVTAVIPDAAKINGREQKVCVICGEGDNFCGREAIIPASLF